MKGDEKIRGISGELWVGTFSSSKTKYQKKERKTKLKKQQKLLVYHRFAWRQQTSKIFLSKEPVRKQQRIQYKAGPPVNK